ncbi:MAG: site-specific DNA-methyltransferase [Clostridiaceae bacterium]|nr:site-specific DNA-methyltransferase [Clostridiaceae bacterium]
MDKIKLLHGDCLEVMKDIPDKSVDLILTDPPYGTTACKWDSVIPFEPMWEELERIITDDGAIVLFGSEPFSSVLRTSNLKRYKYDWKWEKPSGANFLNFKFQPAKVHEDICVFGKMASSYSKRGSMRYNPQMEKGNPYTQKSGKQKTKNNNTSVRSEIEQVITENTGERYPRSVLKFTNDKGRLHPTQKPVELMGYLIKTYTNEGETVLDFTMGSGSTGVACLNTDRNFIGIELDDKYFEIAKERIESHEAQMEKND